MLLKKQIDNNFPRSLSLSTIEMTSKCSKLFFDVISNVDRGTDNGKLLSIANSKSRNYTGKFSATDFSW